jgi:hypothetical protein
MHQWSKALQLQQYTSRAKDGVRMPKKLDLSTRPLCACGNGVATKRTTSKNKIWDTHCSYCRRLIKGTKFERKLSRLVK